MKITQADSNMVAAANQTDNIKWYRPCLPAFRTAGFAFGDEGYHRLPKSSFTMLKKTNPAILMLANNTSGGQLYVRTNSSVLQIKVVLRDTAVLCHMTATGQCGFDCYIKKDGAYQFVNAVKYDKELKSYQFTMFENLQKTQRDILLNFPLYGGVEQLLIGLDDDAAFKTPPSFAQEGRVVVYGTSITQGGCASRPGMSYTNLLSRALDIEFINLGFSGNGNGEPEIVKLVASVTHARLFVIDYEANAGVNGVLEQTFDGVLNAIRAVYPAVPILVLSIINMPSLLNTQAQRTALAQRRMLMQNNLASRTANGDSNLYFLNGAELLGEDWHECTVDGVHPNDLGFYKMACALKAPIQKILSANKNDDKS